MNELFNTSKPDGFTNVNSYVFLDDPQGMISFCEKVFYAEEKSRTLRENGDIGNVILQIGDSCIMLAQAPPAIGPTPSCFYLYTSNVDHLYQRAVDHGAQSVFPPGDQDYGDRSGGVQDPFGNYWWISMRLAEGDYGT
jgi:PhnB protein